MSPKSIEDKITTQILPTLVGRGFQKKNSFLIVQPRGDSEAQIRIGVRKDRITGQPLVSLTIGIRFEEVEKLLLRTQVDPSSSTIGVPIHLLHEDGKFVEWEADHQRIIELLSEQIANYAIPFFEKYHSLDKILAALLSENPGDWFTEVPETRIEKVAAILAVTAQKDHARELLEREILSLGSNHAPPAVARRFRLQKLRDRIAAWQITK